MKAPPLIYRDQILWTASGEEAEWPRLALLGGRIGHSLSPLLHNTAMRAFHLSGEYRAVQLQGEDLGAFLHEALRRGIEGLNITFPHKGLALAKVRRVASSAREVGAANVLVAGREEWEAHNTDAAGFLDAVDECFDGMAWWEGECLVVGAGGVARAVVAALTRREGARVRVLARDVHKARWAEAFGAQVETLGKADLQRCSMLVQATPLGLSPSDPSPVDPWAIPEGCAVMDLCYGPEPSRLVRLYSDRGPVADGLPMLLAQAVRSFQLWFPTLDPSSAMREALRDDLA